MKTQNLIKNVLISCFLTFFTNIYSQVVRPVWTSDSTGTLNGIPFYLTVDQDSKYLSTWDFNGVDFSCAPLDSNETSLDYAGAGDVTIHFDSVVTDFKVYMRYWRTDTYTLNHPFTIMCGSNAVQNNDTILVSGWGNGVLEIQDTVTSITITSDQGCCSHQVLTFGAGVPSFANISELENRSFQVYPNPTSDFVTIQFENPVENGTISVMDVSGRVISNVELSNDLQIQLSVNELNSGLYFVKFSSGNSNSLKSFIKK